MLFLDKVGSLLYGNRPPKPQDLGKDSGELTVTVVIILLVNAVAILSEDRFLSRSAFLNPPPPLSPQGLNHRLKRNNGADPNIINLVGWGNQQETAFGGGTETSVKGKLIKFINAVRTLMRSKELLLSPQTFTKR